jgi:hypothetical protein
MCLDEPADVASGSLESLLAFVCPSSKLIIVVRILPHFMTQTFDSRILGRKYGRVLVGIVQETGGGLDFTGRAGRGKRAT